MTTTKKTPYEVATATRSAIEAIRDQLAEVVVDARTVQEQSTDPEEHKLRLAARKIEMAADETNRFLAAVMTGVTELEPEALK